MVAGTRHLDTTIDGELGSSIVSCQMGERKKLSD